MSKRSSFDRNPRDNYPTPYEAVVPLLPWLPPYTNYCEPCVGEGKLVDHLAKHGHFATETFDIAVDATKMNTVDVGHAAGMIITNPPWGRPVLHEIIKRCTEIRPAWLLVDADWAYTKQAKPYLEHCSMIISIGRVKWIPGSKYTGKDNCCWYKFETYKVPHAPMVINA